MRKNIIYMLLAVVLMCLSIPSGRAALLFQSVAALLVTISFIKALKNRRVTNEHSGDKGEE